MPLYQAAFEWHAIKPWPLTYYAFGAMGQGSSHGLGFAIGVPERRVWVLDGDGSLLMNLGTLVTIAEAAPEKPGSTSSSRTETYEANGAHPIPGAGVVSFAGNREGGGDSQRPRVLGDWRARRGPARNPDGARADLRRPEGGPRRHLRVPLGRGARCGIEGRLPGSHAGRARRAREPVNRHDVVVVGGGHNGLACAAYLARSGLRVLVCERRRIVGGPCAEYEYFPGYRASITNSPGSLEPRGGRGPGARTPRADVHPPGPHVDVPVSRRPRIRRVARPHPGRGADPPILRPGRRRLCRAVRVPERIRRAPRSLAAGAAPDAPGACLPSRDAGRRGGVRQGCSSAASPISSTSSSSPRT